MRATTALRTIWPPLAFGAGIFAVWELVVLVLDLKPYFLPAPHTIIAAFGENLALIRDAAWVTGGNAFVGLVAGVIGGVAMSFVLMRFRVLNEMVTPLAIAVNAIPIFVIVAVLNNQFASTSEIPRRMMVTLIVYFAVLVNVAKGLRQVQPAHLELLRSYAASPLAVLRKARIPNAVPYLFTALKIAAPGAVITAFVAEYFGGNQNGLGARITSNLAISRNAVAWAYVFGAVLVGLAFYLMSIVLEVLIQHQQRGAAPEEST